MTEARLLILDDDDHIGKMVQLIAESVRLTARFMTTTVEFFHAVDEWHPTHIAIDLVMPEMDGVEVLRPAMTRSVTVPPCTSRLQAIHPTRRNRSPGNCGLRSIVVS